jgi:hypothetical protein
MIHSGRVLIEVRASNLQRGEFWTWHPDEGIDD